MAEIPQMPPKLRQALDALVKAAAAVGKEWDAWNESNDGTNDVHAYPPYLPHYPDFVVDLTRFRDENRPIANGDEERVERQRNERDEKNGEKQTAYQRLHLLFQKESRAHEAER